MSFVGRNGTAMCSHKGCPELTKCTFTTVPCQCHPVAVVLLTLVLTRRRPTNIPYTETTTKTNRGVHVTAPTYCTALGTSVHHMWFGPKGGVGAKCVSHEAAHGTYVSNPGIQRFKSYHTCPCAGVMFRHTQWVTRLRPPLVPTTFT